MARRRRIQYAPSPGHVCAWPAPGQRRWLL